jgi:cytidylate kinase
MFGDQQCPYSAICSEMICFRQGRLKNAATVASRAMKKNLLDSFRRYMEAQHAFAKAAPKPQRPAITISRQAGAGAVTIAHLAAKILDDKCPGNPKVPWAVFERNLAEEVLRQHDLPAKLERFMPEDTSFPLNDVVDELLGLHPSSWTLVQHTTHTIRRLASLGNVILVGRGSNIIAAHMPHVFHVRLIAPLKERVRHLQEFYQLKRAEAVQSAHDLDEGRRRYVRRYFRGDVEDPLHYHLTINTTQTGFQKAAQIIANLVEGPGVRSQTRAKIA